MYRPASASPYSLNRHDRYSAKKTAKPVNFICAASDAHRVTLAGDFNDWDLEACPMKRQPDGNWLVQISLTHGHHHYQFIVDGKPVLDPPPRASRATSKTRRFR